jgi:hypothetical protein
VNIHDHCCCAGLASDGYAAVLGAANVRGSDIEPQPDYPYPFEKRDAMEELAEGPPPGVIAHHWSWPCQFATTAGHLRTAQGGTARYGDLLTPGLVGLRSRAWRDTPWVVENVDDNQRKVRRIMAPQPGEWLITLCGSMFGLAVQRHRLFLANFPLRQPEPTGPGVYGQMGCRHDTFPSGPNGRPKPVGVYHVPGDKVPSGGHTARDAEHGRQVMGSHRSLPWDKLKEGFPPAYTSWVAADLLRAAA